MKLHCMHLRTPQLSMSKNGGEKAIMSGLKCTESPVPLPHRSRALTCFVQNTKDSGVSLCLNLSSASSWLWEHSQVLTSLCLRSFLHPQNMGPI